MKKHSLLLTSATLAFIISAPYAHAVSVSMEQGPNGDRVRISQTQGNQDIQSLRVAPDTLFIQVNDAAQNPVQIPSSVDGDFVSGFFPNNDGVSISLSDSAFGFIQSSDANGDILLDIYPDTMGSRWRQSENAKAAYERLEEQHALPSQNTPEAIAQRLAQYQAQAPAFNSAQSQVQTPVNPSVQDQNTTNTPQSIPAPQGIPSQNLSPESQPSAQLAQTTPSTQNSQAQIPSGVVGDQFPTLPQVPQVAQAQTPVQTQVPQVAQAQAPVQTQVQAPVQTQAPQVAQTQVPVQTQAPQVAQQIAPSPNVNIQIPENSNQQVAQATQAPQNINIGLTTPQAPVQQVTQGNSPQNLNIDLASTQAPVQQTTQGAPQGDINIAIDNQNTPAQIPQPQTGSDINIDVANTNNSLQATPDSQANPANTDVNIVAQNNQPSAPTIAQKPTTSFTFSLSDQTESEAKPIVPGEVIAQRMQEEAKEKEVQPETVSQNINQDNTVEITPENINPDMPQEGTMQADTAQDGIASEGSAVTATAQPRPNMDPPDSLRLDAEGLPIVGEFIYIDEEGNVVPAPLNIPQTLEYMTASVKGGKYKDALHAADLLREKPLPPEIMEDVLFSRALSLFQLNRDKLDTQAPEIIQAANDFITTRPHSPKVPTIMSLIVPSALAMNGIDEAKVTVDRLIQDFPKAEETPSSMLLLADAYLKSGNPILASSYLEPLINNYPTSPFIQEAAILQTKSLHKQGDMDKTIAFLDFIDRRFDKVYLTDPEYFIIRGEIEEEAKLYEDMVDTYLTLYNLDPKSELADFALDKVANTYHTLGKKDNARKILQELVASFPESPYRPSALQKIAENGIYDENLTLKEMFDLFNEPNPLLPTIFYDQLVEEYPDSQEAKRARLRLAALSLWEKDYTKAADQALSFFNDYLGTHETDRALEILIRSVAPVLSLAIAEKNYEHVLALWEKYPPIHNSYEPYAPQLRMALGRGLLNRKQEKEGEKMLEPFLENIPTTKEEFDNGIYAYSITLANALKRQDWPKVLEVAGKVENWDLPKDTGLQRLYATALAAQNLNIPARALPIWQALAPNPEVPLYQRAYAQYFLAREAKRRQNLREAYQAYLDTLAMFEDLHAQQSPHADLERNRESMVALMDITEIAGRFTESMQWLNKYRMFVPSSSPDYAGLQLREARLHKKMGDNLRWRAILEQIREKEPESVFGKMAASELRTFEMARDLSAITGRN